MTTTKLTAGHYKVQTDKGVFLISKFKDSYTGGSSVAWEVSEENIFGGTNVIDIVYTKRAALKLIETIN